MSTATRVSVPSAALLAISTPRVTTSSTLWPVAASLRELAPKVLA